MPRGVNRYDEARLQGRLWTPRVYSKTQLSYWWDASNTASLTFSSGNVSTWSDLSGNGRDATDGGVSSRRAIYNPTLFRCPVLSGDGANVRLGFDGTAFVGTSFSIFAAIYRNSSSTQNYFLGGSSLTINNNQHMGWSSDSEFRNGFFFNDINIAVSNYSYPYIQLSRVVFNSGTGRQLWIDQTSGTRADGSSLGAYPGASLFYYEASNTYLNGGIGEIITLNKAVSLAERFILDGYLAWKWQPIGNNTLSADHPFKNRPPLIGD